jgi:hypothetical protein
MSNDNDHSTNPSKSGSIIEILGGVARQAAPQSDIPDEALSALASCGKSAVEQMRAENGLPVRSESLI